MLGSIWDFLSTEGFQPHGMCLLWRADVFWLHLGSDLVIVLSYFSIPGALVYFAARRPDLTYRWVLYLFGAFIVACGLTHIFSIWTLWVPDYGVEAIVKAATAIVSAATAIALWPLMPKLLAIPSSRALQDKNQALAREVAVRSVAEADLKALNEQLERRVRERTDTLEQVNLELLKSRALAISASKAKDHFLAMMSHELRTPLNAIIGFSDILKHERFGPVGTARYGEYANDIHDSGQHLLALINDILDLSKIEAGQNVLHVDEIDICRLARSMMSLMKGSARKGDVRLELDMADNEPPLFADERKLKQILINLLSNAIKFTRPSGTITLKVWSRPESGYVFQVADTGIGIAVEDIPRALSRFQQIDSDLSRKHQGTGLGLPLAKSLVELHGGSFDLQSEVGVGTTVTARFPAERICQIVPGQEMSRAS